MLMTHMKTISLLFVCDTNISLSPLADACLQRVAAEAGLAGQINSSSAGAFAGSTPRSLDRRIKEIAEARELALPPGPSRGLDLALLQAQDLIVVMNENNFWHIKHLWPDITADTMRMLMEFSGQLGLREMPDPLQGEISWQEAYELLDKTTGQLLDELRGMFNLQPAHSAS